MDGKAEVDAAHNDLDTADSPPANSLTDLVVVRLADDDYHCVNLCLQNSVFQTKDRPARSATMGIKQAKDPDTAAAY